MVGLRAFFLLLLAMILMIFDHRIEAFHRLRQDLSAIVLPIQELVNQPIQWVHWLGDGVTAQRRLLEENAQLKVHELLLKLKLQKLLALEHENAQLKELLQSASRVSGKVKAAQLLAVDLDPTIQQVIVDKGRHDGVYQGQPVLDANGVMGQIVDVGPLTSKILLLTDSRFAIPVKDQRNGFRAIAVGTGAAQQLALLHISDKNQVNVGDLFLTSGLGLHFPAGYPVGVVSSIKQISGERFLVVTLVPSAHFDQTQHVILVWPDEEALMKSVRSELEKPLPTGVVGE